MTMPLKQYIKKLVILSKMDLQSDNVFEWTSKMELVKENVIKELENVKNCMIQDIDKVIV